MASTLTRWRPFSEIEDLRRRMERTLETFGDGKESEWTLAVDVVERDDAYVLRASLPGLKTEEIKLEVEDDILTISAEHEESEEDKGENYVRRERRYGAFSRSLALPKGIGVDDIEATSKDGVLEVVIPKPKAPEPQSVTITPKAG